MQHMMNDLNLIMWTNLLITDGVNKKPAILLQEVETKLIQLNSCILSTEGIIHTCIHLLIKLQNYRGKHTVWVWSAFYW